MRSNPVAAVEDRALRLFQRAATMNDPVALLRIGDYHFYGRAGLPPSAEKAAAYYKMSTEHGRSAQVRRNGLPLRASFLSLIDVRTPSAGSMASEPCHTTHGCTSPGSCALGCFARPQ
jgi:TPR repeat protein